MVHGTTVHTLLVVALAVSSCAWAQSSNRSVAAPKVWDDKALADWATPVAGLNVRPGHFSEAEYYRAPLAEWVRTYPVYFPGREPEGYWEMLQRKRPELLITPGARAIEDWIAAGKRIFEELDVPLSRSQDPKVIATIRSRETFEKLGGHPQKDGTVFGFRWVPTSQGVALTVSECAGCHIRFMPDGSRLYGAPFNDPGDALLPQLFATPQVLKGDTVAVNAWRGFTIPWIPNDIHDAMKTMSEKEVNALLASDPPGTFPRFNGSPYYPTKVPDLIGIADRKYIDHTATHRLRGPGDLMRYAVLVGCCDPGDFGPHHALTKAQRVVDYHYPDELLFALAQYIYALKPPANPNLADSRAAAGRKIFEREGCASCHTPPLYTNNKLTLAKGYTLPKDHPYRADVLPISVGTDPNLALKTRKGTGLYKVPSLKGLWYRGLYNHDGSVATLEDWFDPARLRDDYVPSGFKGYKVTHRAVPGHEFGLSLGKDDKTALIAFLKTL